MDNFPNIVAIISDSIYNKTYNIGSMYVRLESVVSIELTFPSMKEVSSFRESDLENMEHRIQTISSVESFSTAFEGNKILLKIRMPEKE